MTTKTKLTFSILTLLFSLCAVLQANEKEPTWRYMKVDQLEIISTLSERELKLLHDDIHYFNRSTEAFFNKPLSKNQYPVPVLVLRTSKELERFLGKDAKFYNGVYGGLRGLKILIARKESSSGEAQSVLYHELTHRNLDSLNLPRWADEGLAGIFQTIDIRKKDIKIGKVNENWMDYHNATHGVGDLDWDIFFNSDYSTWHGDDSEKTSYLYATSWLLTHYCWFSNSALRKSYLSFCKEPLRNETAFKKHFGFGYKELNGKLQGYASNGRYKTYKFKAKSLPQPPEPSIRLATETEYKNIHIRAHLFNPNHSEARALLFDLPKNDRMAAETRAVLAYLDKDRDAARQWTQKAITLGSRNPELLVQHVTFQLGQTLPQRRGQSPMLTPQETQAYLKDLIPALRAYRDNTKAIRALIGILDAANSTAPAQFEPMFQLWEIREAKKYPKIKRSLDSIRARS